MTLRNLAGGSYFYSHRVPELGKLARVWNVSIRCLSFGPFRFSHKDSDASRLLKRLRDQQLGRGHVRQEWKKADMGNVIKAASTEGAGRSRESLPLSYWNTHTSMPALIGWGVFQALGGRRDVNWETAFRWRNQILDLRSEAWERTGALTASATGYDWSIVDLMNRWGNSGNSGWLYVFGLQNHCGWWRYPWN